MAYEFYASIEGEKQGKFKGESGREAHKDKIAARAIKYECAAPFDPQNGQTTGRRQHKPIVLTKEWGGSSPQLLQALCTNEALKSVLFEFVKHDRQGAEYVYYTIKLSNARVVKIDQYSAETPGSQTHDLNELEDVSFTFDKIEWENKDAKTMTMDDWRK